MIAYFFITVLVIYGIHGSTRAGMVFSVDRLYDKLGNWLENNTIDKIYKPLFDCTPCMASVYGTIAYFFIVEFSLDRLLFLPVWVFSISGFNYILNKFMNK
jgi:hypothetical protein